MKNQEKKEELATVKIPRDMWWELKKLSVERQMNFREYVHEILLNFLKEKAKKEANDKDDEIKLF